MDETAMPLFNFRMDADTKRKLELLARATERDMSGYLRWIIRREYDAHFTRLPLAPTVNAQPQDMQS